MGQIANRRARAAAVLALALASPLAAAGEHFQMSAAVRPESVRPGGFVELVLKVETEPGWHVFSPRSDALGVELAIEPPDGLTPFGRTRVPAGSWKDYPVLGRVESLEGSFELVQRFRVDDQLEPGTLSIGGTLRAFVGQADACLPPQSIPFAADIRAASDGEPGPCPPAADLDADLTGPERLQLVARGFVVRARPEDERVVPGQGFFLLVEVAVAPNTTLALGRALRSDLTDRNDHQNFSPGCTVSGAADIAGPALGRLAGELLAEDLGGTVVTHGQPVRAWLPLIAAEDDPWAEPGSDRFELELLIDGELTRSGEERAAIAERVAVGLPIEREPAAPAAAPRK